MAAPTEAEYEAQLLDLARTRAGHFAIDAPGWTKSKEKHDISYWTRDGESIPCVRAIGFLPDVSPSQAIAWLEDGPRRKEYDPNRNQKDYRTLMLWTASDPSLGTVEVYYNPLFAMLGGIISARDFCCVRNFVVAPDGRSAFMSWRSTAHPDGASRPGHVRATCLPSGMHFSVAAGATPEAGCLLSYVVQTDPGGWIPAMAATGGTMDAVKGTFKYLKKRGQEAKGQ